MYVSNWEDNVNDDNKGSIYDCKSTEEAVRNRNARQPKGLLDNSEDSIITNSGTKTVIGTNSKESSDDESSTEPPCYLDWNELQDSSDDKSIPRKSVQISHKYRRESLKNDGQQWLQGSAPQQINTRIVPAPTTMKKMEQWK